MRPVRTQFPYGLHARQCQQAGNAIRLQLPDGIFVILTPAYRCFFPRISAFHPHDRKVKRLSDGSDSTVQLRSERMRRIYQKPDTVFRAERSHGRFIHSAGNMRTVPALDLLKVAPGGIPVRRTRRIGHPDRQASFSRSTENEYHDPVLFPEQMLEFVRIETRKALAVAYGIADDQ